MSRYTKTKIMKKLKSFLQNDHFRHWTGILALLALSVGSMQIHHSDFMLTSILDEPEYVFEGTVSPLEYMLDYSELESGDRDLDYNNLLAEGGGKMIPHLLHTYNQANLSFDLDDIDWSDESEVEKLNLQYNITVPYTGNYSLDSCGMGCGSHPAVDWVTPMGTPLMAASTGKVTKVSEQSSGFGYHVVVETQGAPHPTNAGEKTTIYFGYSHLSQIYVNEGDIVHVGDFLGLTGESGTATTPHLHWDLALESAPYVPYWPFTWSEANEAGLNFWSAVNEGLGMDNIHAHTADPAIYVLEYNIDTYVAPEPVEEEDVIEIDSELVEELLEEIQADEEELEELEDEDIEEVVEEEELVEELEETSVATMDISAIDVDMPSFIMTGDQREIEIILYDSTGEVLTSPQFTDKIDISFADDSIAKLNRSVLDKYDFTDGIAKLDLYGQLEGDTTIIFEVANSTFTTTPLYIIDEVKPFTKFGVATDGYFVPNVSESIQIQSLDLEGMPTPTAPSGGVVELEVIEGTATLSPSELSVKDFVNGIAEVEIYSEDIDDIVVQVTYGTKVVESEALQVQEFIDLSSSDDYYPAVSYLRTQGTISGYPDGSFQPEREVSRIEGLKFIISGLDVPLSLGKTVSFSDTEASGAWYSDVLATAEGIGIVKGYADGTFKPTSGVNRVELLTMLFASADISLDPVVIGDPAKDVDNLTWYAPAVQYALEMNIFPDANSNKNFNPGQAMTRIEVAEAIYRLIIVQHNDEPYSVQLEVPNL
jgi:hypothetical protein